MFRWGTLRLIPSAPERPVRPPSGPHPPGRPSPHTGLGLGLYIGAQRVEAHGGSLSVRSTNEEGTCFTIALPRDNTNGNGNGGASA